MRVLHHRRVLAELLNVRREGTKLRAVWHGPPPPFEPSEQVEPLVLESDDGLRCEEGWLHRIWRPEDGDPIVELGSERDAPAWRKGGTCLISSQRSEPQTVLVVDDDADMVELIAESLELEGWRVVPATSGKQALELASQTPPDVAIVDLIMPEVTGEEVCNAIRRDSNLGCTRILVLSAAEDTRQVAAECDADGAITKPFTIPLLLREVHRLLGS